MEKVYTLKSGRAVKVTASRKRTSHTWGEAHFAYTIDMLAGDASYKFTYHDSPYNYQRGIGMTQEMIDGAVMCALLDADSYAQYMSSEDFIRAYGYGDLREGVKAYWGCREASERLEQMMTQDEREELYQIVDC